MYSKYSSSHTFSKSSIPKFSKLFSSGITLFRKFHILKKSKERLKLTFTLL